MKINTKAFINLLIILLAIIPLTSALNVQYNTLLYYGSMFIITILSFVFSKPLSFLSRSFVRPLVIFTFIISLVFFASSDIDGLFNFLLGSGPGLVFFFLISVSYFNLLDFYKGIKFSHEKSFNYIVFLFPVILSLAISLITLYSFQFDPEFVALRGSRLSLSLGDIDTTIAYQRISYNYLSLSLLSLYLLLPLLINQAYLIPKRPFSYRNIDTSLSVWVSLTLFLSLFVSGISIRYFALITSNAGIYFSSILFVTYLYYFSKLLFHTRFFGYLPTLKGFFPFSIMFSIFLLSVFVFLFYKLDFSSLSAFKIFNADGINLNSLYSRFSVNQNFLRHLEFNGYILGGFNVEKYTTGVGSYSHSFLLSLITHGGLIGLFSFFPVLYLTLREFRLVFFHRQALIPSFTILMFIFVFANFATIFTWRPLFFSFLLHFCLSRSFLFEKVIIRAPRIKF